MSEAARPLSRSQFFWIFQMLEAPPAQRHQYVTTRLVALPPGRRTADVTAAVREVVARHGVLRTRIAHRPGSGMTGVVDPATDMDVPVRRLEDCGYVGVTGLVDDLSHRAADIEGCWPIQASVLTLDDQPRYLAVAIHRHAADQEALAVLEGEFGHLLGARHGDTGPVLPAAGTAEERLAHEADPARGTQRRQAREHWARLLRGAPTVSFPYHAEPGGSGTVRTLTLTSPALGLVLPTVARRCGQAASAVVLTVASMVLRCYTGSSIRWSLVADKGARPGAGPVVETRLQPVVVDVDLPLGAPFPAAVAVTASAMLTAQRFADYDYCEFLDDRAALWGSRGGVTQVDAYYHAMTVAAGDGYTGRVRRVSAGVRARTTIEWGAVESAKRGLELSAADSADGCVLALLAERRVLDDAAMLTVLRRVESLLCDVAAGADPTIDEVAAGLPGDWPRPPEGCFARAGVWADPDLMRELWLTDPRVRTAHVGPAGDGTPRLVASLEVTADLPDPLRPLLPYWDHPGVVRPDEVVVHRLPPDASAAAPPEPVRRPQVVALLAAVRQVTADPAVGPEASFRDQGGRAALVPSIQRCLELAGWTGLRGRALLGPQPLEQLAGALEALPAAHHREPLDAR
ncbi:Condensation domain-containing protein [Micromonospora haikouensis]|uniref:Condensation domain-containing protein n=1 Tax=Micromonospora haikouensis TaxID=686309 RepID=A0A1C4XGG9_9ACTN|nr:condensation domain-containing protein [Micromonospora haikouensis]SCF07628.1 Condensation domain-containing protein [Micromonospora haikouensis]